MKIISGKYKGRLINGYNIEGTRPTMDRVRESLFAILTPFLIDKKVLDLFAGTGSLGLEAISNGAKEVTFVDRNKKCIDEIKKTMNQIKFEEKATLYNLEYYIAIKELAKNNQKFDIIFLDPPYHENILNKAIKKILENDLLNENGLIVAEYDSEIPVIDFEIIKEKKYGDKWIRIYKKNQV